MVEGALKYPSVIGEFDTVHKILDGFSIARFGDGEFKMSDGKGYRRQEANRKLASELKQVLHDPNERCIVGIPTMDQCGAKYENWLRHYDRFVGMLSPTLQYYSAFISRPDSAQWIMVREYAELFQKLWVGKKAVVVCEPDNSLLGVVQKTARKVLHVSCPSTEAWGLIGHFERSILKSRPDVALLSVGPTATCLANRLSDRVHTIDAGSCGGFIRKLLE